MNTGRLVTDQNSPCNTNRDIRINIMRQERAEFENQITSLRQQLLKLSSLSDENEYLKDEVYKRDAIINSLQQTINQLKEQLHKNHSENMKIFQQSEKCKRQFEKLSIDNESMEMQISKLKGQRRIFTSKVQEIRVMKDQIGDKLVERERAFQQTLMAKKQIERQLTQYKLTVEELSQQINIKDQKIYQLQSEVKISLQNQLQSRNLLTKYKNQLNELNAHTKHFKQQKQEVQRERDDIYEKLQQYQSSSRNQRSSDMINTNTQTTLLQIQSFMNQINVLLDKNKNESQKSNKINRDLKVSLQCLQKLIK